MVIAAQASGGVNGLTELSSLVRYFSGFYVLSLIAALLMNILFINTLFISGRLINGLPTSGLEDLLLIYIMNKVNIKTIGFT
jgi:hypothetical protein